MMQQDYLALRATPSCGIGFESGVSPVNNIDGKGLTTKNKSMVKSLLAIVLYNKSLSLSLLPEMLSYNVYRLYCT